MWILRKYREKLLPTRGKERKEMSTFMDGIKNPFPFLVSFLCGHDSMYNVYVREYFT